MHEILKRILRAAGRRSVTRTPLVARDPGRAPTPTGRWAARPADWSGDELPIAGRISFGRGSAERHTTLRWSARYRHEDDSLVWGLSHGLLGAIHVQAGGGTQSARQHRHRRGCSRRSFCHTARTVPDREWRIRRGVEPADTIHEELLRNVALNGTSNRTVEHRALDVESGTGVLYVEGVRSSLVKPTKGPTDCRESIEVVSVDDYVERHAIGDVSLLFLDIEGAEQQALKGAEKLLRRSNPPDVIFEIIPTVPPERSTAVRFLTQLDYSLYYIGDDYSLRLKQELTHVRVRPLRATAIKERYFNVLATRQPDLLASLGVVTE